MKPMNKNGTIAIIALILLIPASFYVYSQWTSTIAATNPIEFSKQKGAHYFARLDSAFTKPLEEHNIEWVAWVNWAYQDDFNSSQLRHHNGDSAMIRDANSSWVENIKKIRQNGYKVFVKPHIWLAKPSNGKWRSHIHPDNESDWIIWKDNYRNFILRYAKLSEEANAEMFCIGTELTQLSLNKPKFWRDLIKEVRTIYSGKITYGANWYEEYEKIEFWDELDYIGVQAYFPLTEKENPTLNEIEFGWQKYLPTLEKISNKFQKKILFTELGYRSIVKGAKEPWLWIEKSCNEIDQYSPETQANSYEAFFNQVWDKNWFAGVHLWKLKDFKIKTGQIDLNFTPRGKPASKIIANRFKN